MTNATSTKQQYVDASTGGTADSVYVTTLCGDEIGSYDGACWCDDFIDKLEAKYGRIRAEFCGGTLDGFDAY